MTSTEHLVSFGKAGEIARFRAVAPLSLQRGDQVVVRTAHGLEIGNVLCEATARHAELLDNPAVGELLRLATPEDAAIASGIRDRAKQLFTDARALAEELHLPLEIVDIEIPLDGHEVTLYYLRWAEGDERPLVSALSKRYELMIGMRNLALPEGASACGKPDCGNGQCSSCGTDGGCSTGGCSTGCGSKKKSAEVREYFAGLREKMLPSRRVPLT
jgi:cell fate regulator YaaT (PSP1 superfamily)